jgi:predicted secreted protein
MKKYSFVLFIVMIVSFGCSDSSLPTETQFDSSINGKNITIIPGHAYTLELDLNADAGYQWDYSISDNDVIGIDSTSYRPKSGNLNLCGGITVATFYFRGKKSGLCFVKLIEHQVWVKDVPPINTIRFSVNVK